MAARLSEQRATMPVVEERAVVRKRKKVTGAIRVRTVVHEVEELIDEPLSTEQVDVEHVPVDRWVEAPVPVRQEGQTTIISIHEEVVVVEKRLRLVEEVRITRRASIHRAGERVTLRREEAVVERLEPPDREAEPG